MPTCRRTCYAMSGTDIPYCASPAVKGPNDDNAGEVRYGPTRFAMRCPVLRQRVVLSTYALAGTDIAYGVFHILAGYAMPGTERESGATRGSKAALLDGEEVGRTGELSAYALATQCPVLVQLMVPSAYALATR
eukprot:3872340-Rhodomonas_salina.3